MEVKCTIKMEIVKKDTNFYSLVASKQYCSGDLIFTLSGVLLSSPTRTSIEIACDMHIEDKHGMYMNHSFEPTTRIDAFRVIAAKSINIGDELTFDYTTTETKLAYPFVDNKTLKKVEGKVVV